MIGSKTILHDINVHVHCRELTAIIGPNGAGKSTLLKAIVGQQNYTGSIHFVRSHHKKPGQPIIGYIPQNFSFDEDSPVSVLDFITACLSVYPVWLPIPKYLVNQASNILTVVKAEHLLHHRLGTLSGGELQRVLLSLALRSAPNLLLLDEPISGIDSKGQELFFTLLRQIRKSFDTSILMVSHDLGWIREYADRVILLNKTVLRDGSPSLVYESSEFKETFHL